MTRELLSAASEELSDAADTAEDELRERISDQADALAALAEADRGPDHGRLARHMNALSEIAEQASEDIEERVESARDKVSEYREGVEGV
ncbi:hypothetical protein C499_11391 [Halogeometricum borinquense DSM 11551]|uniref:Uncharacterized protein n=1 Tax=Halogeometricum borinquense (strain ATCC 700274 / DSM 11551 / JCM 10706 / KCTC 4070 / PR3) TaxID=469382 RepID=E4NSR7_HALBP|nr:hypothetical protein [Halogeometricum borinquense]ADQ65805.1 hypothetical protein Hbor_01940 [Halogeometricum borinquense DSM 11551]ELY26807.1 hypothetical protein C499_11391 [Halogeometricum borinquense DSM 11551]